MKTYLWWNAKLFEHAFEDPRRGPVERIAATPEELCCVVGADPSQSSALVNQLATAILGELTEEGHSFLSYCVAYRLPGDNARRIRWVRTDYQEYPYFFACLWLSCLAAYGHPPELGNYQARLAALLEHGGNLAPLPHGGLYDAWADVAEWTRRWPEHYRPLVLPDRDEKFRTNIWPSYYLAFPNRDDRQTLAKVLRGAGLANGVEPAFDAAFRAVHDSITEFGHEFRVEFDEFQTRYLAAHREPFDSAFWRAVRQEALSPIGVAGGAAPGAAGRATLFAETDSDGSLQPYVACTPDWQAPAGFERAELNMPWDGFTCCIVARRADIAADPGGAGVLVDPGLLDGTGRQAVEGGIVPLLAVASGIHRLARGDEVEGCESALVRSYRLAAFVRAFGGRHWPSVIDDWHEVHGCRVGTSGQVAEGLEDAAILVCTSTPPRPNFVGGLRPRRGAFYRHRDYRPFVRASGAAEVDVLLEGGGRRACSSSEEEAEKGLWSLPVDLPFDQMPRLVVEARWDNVRMGGYEVERRGRCDADLVALPSGDDYRGVPAGEFWRECCDKQLAPVQGPTGDVPLGITSHDPRHVGDFLEFDGTARWLGPGVGEMSLEPREGLPWLVVGQKKRPELLVFVGTPETDRPPNPTTVRRSENSANKRHWKQAIADVATDRVFWRRGRAYEAVDSASPVDAIRRGYRSVASTQGKGDKGFFGEKVLADLPNDDAGWGEAKQHSGVRRLSEVLAIIGRNQAGISVSELHEHLGLLTGTERDHLAREHLVRGWVESGVLAYLRRQDGRQHIVVPRRPRLVLYRRGPHFVGIVAGLVPPAVLGRVQEAASDCGLAATWLRPPNQFQPRVPRFSGPLRCFDDLAREFDWAASSHREYVDWPCDGEVPEYLRITGDLQTPPAPENYSRSAGIWCWTANRFTATPEDPGEFPVVRRRFAKRAAIYVVLNDGRDLAWSYSRTWALLDAAEREGRRPFELTRSGELCGVDSAPLHLPLPLARLCAALGIGLPGPAISNGVTRAYVYPFGQRLTRLVARVIPAAWLSNREG